jgi:hypothetical protein
MQQHRASKREQQVTQQQTQNEGSKTMSELFKPDTQLLQRLQEIEVGFYNTRTHCNIQGREQSGLMETFEVQGVQQALDRYVELVGLGYTATGEIAHLPKVESHPHGDWVLLSLRRPAAEVEKDIAQILAQVEFDYLARLETEKSAAVAKEVQSLLDRERGKRRQAELDAKAAQDAEEYARVEAEVLAALGEQQ